MAKELSEKEKELLEYISLEYGLDFSGYKPRLTKKGHLLVEDKGSPVFRIEKKYLEAILNGDYRTNETILLSADKSSASYKNYLDYIRKQQEEAARRRKEKKAAKTAEKQRQRQAWEEWKVRAMADFHLNLDAVMTDIKTDPFLKLAWSYENMQFGYCYGKEMWVTISIQQDVRGVNGLKLAYICRNKNVRLDPLNKEDIRDNVKKIMSSRKAEVSMSDEGRQFLQRKTYLLLKKLKGMSVCPEFLKIVDESDFFAYMNFLKHNHAKECQDRIRISNIQLMRRTVLKYQVFGQEVLYNLKEDSISFPDETLSKLKNLASFENAHRASIKSCLKIAEKIGHPQYRVAENEQGEFGIQVCALIRKKNIEQMFLPEEFSPANLRRWYKEKEKEIETEEREQEYQNIEHAKSLKSFGNLLASDIYELVCSNDYITESAIVKNMRGMTQTLQATIKDVGNSGRYVYLTNDEVEKIYSLMIHENLIYERAIDGTYGRFYKVKPRPEGKLLSCAPVIEKKPFSNFLDTDWVLYMKKVADTGKERRMTKKEEQEQMKLLEQKRVICIYPELVKQFLRRKPEYWKDFAFTMYSMETGIQKKYWKYVIGLFEEKKDDSK